MALMRSCLVEASSFPSSFCSTRQLLRRASLSMPWSISSMWSLTSRAPDVTLLNPPSFLLSLRMWVLAPRFLISRRTMYTLSSMPNSSSTTASPRP